MAKKSWKRRRNIDVSKKFICTEKNTINKPKEINEEGQNASRQIIESTEDTSAAY